MKKIIFFIMSVICLTAYSYGVEIVDDTVVGCIAHDKSEVNIPYSAREIEAGAFKGCAHIEKVILPGTVSRIGEGAFEGTSFLESVSNYTEGVLVANGVLIKAAPNVEVVRVPDGVRLIADGAFQNCNLKKLYLPQSIEKFSINAFYSLTHKVAVHYGGDYDEFLSRADFSPDKIDLHTRDEKVSLIWLVALFAAMIITIFAITYPWKEEK